MNQSTRRDFLKSTGSGFALMFLPDSGIKSSAKKKQPDILLIIADDLCWRDCGCYGNREVSTPNIDKLAKEGMRFDAAFTATAMCAPTRQQLYTGIFPVRNGAYPNHSHVYPGTQSMVQHLKKLGYRVGLTGKTHFGPRASFPFEFIKNGKAGGLNSDAIEEFINRDSSQPYCLVVASHYPHSPWIDGPKNLYDPRKLTVPPYLFDNLETRKGLAAYYAEVTALDVQVGECMRIVDRSSRKNNTIFIFTSEQGSSFPFGGKWTCYENGLKTAFIARWPQEVKPGSSTKAMVQYVDVLPTLIKAAGGKPETINTGRPGACDGGNGFDGTSFLDVLTGKKSEHRKYVYGVHTTRGIINGSKCYPVRSVRSDRYKFIMNLNSETSFRNILTRKNPRSIFGSWVRDSEKNKFAARLVRLYQHRPPEELYDLRKDQYEFHNLAGDPGYRKIKEQLKTKLLDWMKQQGDKGNETELKAFERQGKGQKKNKKTGKQKEKKK